MPSLSIAICAKDEQRYLGAQLQAIRRQSVRPDEIVLLDDGSTDDTPGIMAAFAARTPNVRIVTHARPVGAIPAFLRAVSESTGDIVWPLSANDILQPDAIRHVADLARLHPDASILAGDTVSLDCSWTDRPRVFTGEEMAEGIGRVGVLHGGSTAISRAAWDRVGGFLLDVGGWTDVFTWHATAVRDGAAICPYPLLEVRQHAGGVNQSLHTPEKRGAALATLAHAVANLEEPTRARLLASGLFDLSGLVGVRDLVADAMGVPA